MSKIIKNNLGNSLVILLIFALVTSWIFSGWPRIWQNPPIPPGVQEAQAAVAFQGVSAIADSTGVDVTVILPAYEANDIFLLQVVVRDTDDTITITDWTEITSITDGTAAKHWWFWKRASASETNPLVDKSGTTGDTYASVTSYRGAETSGDPWEAKGTAACTGTANPITLNGISTLTDNALVVASWNDIDNFLASATYTPTDPSSLTSDMLNQSAVGADGTNASGSAVKTTAGVTGNVSVNPNKAPDGACGVVLGLKVVVVSYAISISSGDGTIDYGYVSFGGTTSTDPAGSNLDPQTFQNDSNVPAQFNIMTGNAVNGTGWTAVAGIPGSNEFRHSFATTSPVTYWKLMGIDPGYAMASSSVAVSGTITFYLQIEMPSASDYITKDITVTVQAAAP